VQCISGTIILQKLDCATSLQGDEIFNI